MSFIALLERKKWFSVYVANGFKYYANLQ